MSVCFGGCCDASALISPRLSHTYVRVSPVHVFNTQHEKERDRELKEEQSDSLLLLRIIKSSCLYIYAALKYECDDCLRAFVKPNIWSLVDVAKVLKIPHYNHPETILDGCDANDGFANFETSFTK
jgi:hypothetical protein